MINQYEYNLIEALLEQIGLNYWLNGRKETRFHPLYQAFMGLDDDYLKNITDYIRQSEMVDTDISTQDSALLLGFITQSNLYRRLKFNLFERLESAFPDSVVRLIPASIIEIALKHGWWPKVPTRQFMDVDAWYSGRLIQRTIFSEPAK